MKREPLHRSAELPVLEVVHPDGRLERHSILGREVTIGRDRANRVWIQDHFISKFHAKIIVRDRDFTVVDLGSANKTRVNGQVVSESPLFFGDELHFAAVRCRFVLPSLRGERGSRRRADHPVGTHTSAGPSEPEATVRPRADASTESAPATQIEMRAVERPSDESVRLPVGGIAAIAEIPASMSWAGPMDPSATRRFRAIFFGILVGIAIAVLMTGRSFIR